jgi:hypothetical protein
MPVSLTRIFAHVPEANNDEEEYEEASVVTAEARVADLAAFSDEPELRGDAVH